MKKILYIFLFTFISQHSVYSQPSITWQHTYPPPIGYGYKSNGQSVCPADENNFYLVGSLYSNPQGSFDIIKINSYGDTIWTRVVNSIGTTDAGGVSSGDGGIVCSAEGVAHTVKFDKDGSLIWNKNYYIAPSYCFKIIRTHDGKYIICGQYDGWYGLIFKVDSLGNLIWSKYYNESYFAGWYNSIIETPDNNFIAVGFRTRNENDTVRGLITKIDTAGNIIFEKEYGLFNIDVTNFISIDKINYGYIISGTTSDSNRTQDVVYFIKIDELGNLLFSKRFEGEYNLNYEANDSKKINENKYLFCSNGYHGIDAVKTKIFLTDSLGNILQQRTFEDTTFDAILKRAYLIGNGDIIFVGESGYDHPGFYGYDITWSVRMDSSLNLPPIGIRILNNNIPLSFRLLQNYPNPFNPTTTIIYQIPIDTHVKLIIYDLLGREVSILLDKNLKKGFYEIKWDGTKSSSGIYFYKLETQYYSITKKMVLIR